jgi:putative addiction module CopG family antidote
MTLILSAELRQFIDEEVRLGRYPSEQAAVADALLRMKAERERLAWLQREIEKGVKSLDAGDGRGWDDVHAVSRLEARLREAGGGAVS